MKYFNSITVSVFAKPEENAEVLKKGLLALIPFELEAEKVLLSDQTATGFNQRTIHIYSITIEKERHMNAFMDFFTSKLNNQQHTQLVREAETRLDPELMFFIRIDKDLWANEQAVLLTDSGHCYHLKFAIAAFPRKREVALGIATNVFKPAPSA